MLFKRKEAKLLAVLIAALYVLAFFKFIWVPIVPQIAAVNSKISEAEEKKASLDKELSNIDTTKAELEMLKTMNERIDKYLMKSSFLVESLDYVNKLGMYINDSLTDLNISSPQEKNAQSTKYYEVKIDFKALMSYDDAIKLVDYLEGAPVKTKIVRFVVKPLPKDRQDTVSKEYGYDELYELSMSICLYTMNLRESDQVYVYSSYRLGSQNDSKGSVLVRPTVKITGEKSKTERIADIAITQKSYLSGGENLQIISRGAQNNVLRIKTDDLVEIALSLTDDFYTLNTRGGAGDSRNIMGDIPAEDLLIHINANIPDIPENKNIRIILNIKNDSSKKINVLLEDNQKRVVIMDRNGSRIFGSSLSESLDIL